MPVPNPASPWASSCAPLVNADSAVVTSTPPPISSNSRSPRTRPRNGLGRWWRGTAQTWFMAFCPAWANPSPP